MKKPAKNTYPWAFASVGGSVRVKIRNGEDIRHLGELDRKMWTVLSCPVNNLEFDEKCLKFIDVDNDGKIRVDEVIATANWLTGILKNPDILLEEKGRDLDGQLGILQRDGADRTEPHLKLLGLDVLLNDSQTVVPNFNMSLLKTHFVVQTATN